MIELKDTICAVCGHKEAKEIYPAKMEDIKLATDPVTFSARISQNQHYKIVRCTNCGMLRSDPVMPEELANRLYCESNMSYGDELGYLTRTYSNILKTIPLAQEGKRTLLEIGCGSGTFLESALSLGYDNIIGFEPSKECCEKASPSVKGHIVNDVFNAGKIKENSVDVVGIFHTIDHLYDPKKMLRDSLKVLKPGGHIMIVCHDLNALTAKILKDKSPIFNIQHIYYFDQKTMRLILENNGYEVVKVGALTNIYKLIYWLKTLFRGSKMLDLVPGFIANIPTPLRA